ncbi:hypothetical protein FB567DRAFT_613080, partial [Paraphoma chrysanthemicola]
YSHLNNDYISRHPLQHTLQSSLCNTLQIRSPKITSQHLIMKLTLITTSVLVTLSTCAPLAAVGDPTGPTISLNQPRSAQRLIVGFNAGTSGPGPLLAVKNRRSAQGARFDDFTATHPPSPNQRRIAQLENIIPRRPAGTNLEVAPRRSERLQVDSTRDESPGISANQPRSAQRLANGLRINPAEDDRAGLQIVSNQPRSAQTIPDGSGVNSDGFAVLRPGPGAAKRSAQGLANDVWRNPGQGNAAGLQV